MPGFLFGTCTAGAGSWPTPDTKVMFGTKDQVTPVRHLIGSATAWGGNPETEAFYLNVTPQRNDGKTVHKLTVKDVPVDGLWSINVYNTKGFFEANPQDSYSINNITAKKASDGSVTVQFGGCDGKAPKCLPITLGWNYMVRLHRPRPEILNGNWVFPDPHICLIVSDFHALLLAGVDRRTNAWPSSSWSTRMFTPCSGIWVAKLWRRVWQPTFLSSPACSAARFTAFCKPDSQT
jgi:hypothetical protein